METNNLKIILLVGCPGSGKSTYAKALLSNDATLNILNMDTIRAEIGSGESDNSINWIVFGIFRNRIKEHLQNNRSVIIDATSVNRKYRKGYIKIAKTYGAKIIAYVFECSKDTLIERNINRKNSGGRMVSESVIDFMLASYKRPVLEEGFDEIHLI